MFGNYFKLAWRNIKKYKGFSFLNILGLALGLAGCYLILLWVNDELSYDRFHENAENIYRIEQDQFYNGQKYHVNVTPFVVGGAFVEKLPEVLESVRIGWVPGNSLISYGDKKFFEDKLITADPAILTMLSFPLIQGDPNSALKTPESVVITQEMAKKYFGEENPIGKVFQFNNEYNFMVGGVIRNVPRNSTFDFNIIFPTDFMKTLGRYNESWGSNNLTTLLQIAPGADLAAINQKMTTILHENNPGSTAEYMLAPLTGLHLYSYFGFNSSGKLITIVYIFSLIAVFVLIIACINFMNLSTARSANRAKEIGVRKVVGGLRHHLIWQFLGESVLMTFLAVLLAVVLMVLLLPAFNAITQKEIAVAALASPKFIFSMLTIMLVTGLLSGSYPALVLSSFKPVKVLKSGFKNRRGNGFRRVLVVFQFVLSIFLIIGTVTIYRQIEYMNDKQYGFDKDNVVYINMQGKTKDFFPALKNELLRHPEFLAVSASSNRPTHIGSNSGGARWQGKDPNVKILVGMEFVDYDYVSAAGMELAEGRDFSMDFPADRIGLGKDDTTGNFLINATLADIMGREDALNRPFRFLGITGNVVGIIKDFHFGSMRDEIEPLAIMLLPERTQNVLIRLKGGNIRQALGQLEKTWNETVPGYPCAYHFLNEDLDRMYQVESRIGSILKYFAIFAILIACLGLFGLASFVAEQRTKEIAVRKVLGAKVPDLLFTLTREFALWILVANLIAWPLTWFVLSRFMQTYAYNCGVAWWLFPAALMVTLAAALFSTGYQSLKTAVVNPVDLIRYE